MRALSSQRCIRSPNDDQRKDRFPYHRTTAGTLIRERERDSERSADLTCAGERRGHFIPTAINISICACCVLKQIGQVSIQTALSCSTDSACSFNQCYSRPCQVLSQLIWHDINLLRLLQSENNLEWDLMQICLIKIVLLTSNVSLQKAAPGLPCSLWAWTCFDYIAISFHWLKIFILSIIMMILITTTINNQYITS